MTQQFNRFALATVLAVGMSGISMAGEFRANCGASEAPADCKRWADILIPQYQKAVKGDYAARRNVAFCYMDGCEVKIRIDVVDGCAFRLLILGTNLRERTSGDFSNARTDCGKLSPDELRVADGRARDLARRAGQPWSDR